MILFFSVNSRASPFFQDLPKVFPPTVLILIRTQIHELKESEWRHLAQKGVSHIAFTRLYKSSQVYWYSPTPHMSQRALQPTMASLLNSTQVTKTREKAEQVDGQLGGAVEWRRRSERVFGGVMVCQWPVKCCIQECWNTCCCKSCRYVLKDANVSPSDFHFSLSICASPTFASSFCLSVSHCQAGALMLNMLFPPLLQHNFCAGSLCT